MNDSIISTGLLSDISIREKAISNEAPKGNELGRDAFLELLVTQMQNQNPLNPQENSEFVAQLAQFSSVEGLDKLNNTMDDMSSSLRSNQALQASSMVGRTVKVPTNTAELTSGGLVPGTIELPYSSSSVVMNVYDQSNQLVAQQMMGAMAAGEVDFAWDGLDNSGATLPPGNYKFEVLASQGNGDVVQAKTWLGANVDSVTVSNNGSFTLNIAGIGPLQLSQVKEIL
jgi:flagellar basal-body rod modification protein FlgD